jgi:hypothetical protein
LFFCTISEVVNIQLNWREFDELAIEWIGVFPEE